MGSMELSVLRLTALLAQTRPLSLLSRLLFLLGHYPSAVGSVQAMCYFDQTKWHCGYWRWGHFRQQCNKEYRIGETCGLKLVFDTICLNEVCKLCKDIDKKRRRYDKMQRDVERWQREDSKRNATIEKTCGEMQELSAQIYSMQQQHCQRVQSVY